MSVQVGISLQFGAMAAPLGKQLADQGVEVVNQHILLHFQRDADAIARLAVRGLLPDSAVRNARKKLLKAIVDLSTSAKEKA